MKNQDFVVEDEVMRSLLEDLKNIPEDFDPLDHDPKWAAELRELEKEQAEAEAEAALSISQSDPALLEETDEVENKPKRRNEITYLFPPVHKDFGLLSDAELCRELHEKYRNCHSSNIALGYGTVRTDICAISIEMNLRQKQAPRFRPTKALAHKPPTAGELNMALDRQVIDLHWHAHTPDCTSETIDDYPYIFDTDPFDFELASEFAMEKWGAPAKALKLHLSNDQQWRSAVIQSKKIRERWRVISRGDLCGGIIKQAGAPQIESRLRDAIVMSRNPSNLKDLPGMVKTWLARKIVGESPSQVSTMISLMTGERKRDPSSVAKTMKTIDRLLS